MSKRSKMFWRERGSTDRAECKTGKLDCIKEKGEIKTWKIIVSTWNEIVYQLGWRLRMKCFLRRTLTSPRYHLRPRQRHSFEACEDRSIARLSYYRLGEEKQQRDESCEVLKKILSIFAIASNMMVYFWCILMKTSKIFRINTLSFLLQNAENGRIIEDVRIQKERKGSASLGAFHVIS